MSNLIAKEYKCFEDIKRIKDDGTEYWTARELAFVLGYTKWENFHKVIKRAMIACENSGKSINDHFPEVRKMIEVAKGAKRKGLAVGQKILDYMGSTELIANLFRISQNEEKLRKDQVSDAETATKVHGAVGREVRKAIEEIGGTMPENLPTPEKSIAQIEKEQLARLKKKAKQGTLMLDE